MISRANPRPVFASTFARLLLFAGGCATPAAVPGGAAEPVPVAGASGGRAPRVERQDPFSGGGGERPASLVALEAELRRGMAELAKKADPPPYFMSYDMFDRDETVVSASYGALVQSSSRRTLLLDTDVRVGSFQLDSTHPLRTDAFDFGGDLDNGHAVALPLHASAAPGVTQAVAWLDTDRTYKNASEAFVKIRTQRMLKAAEEDESDDFSHEKPATYVGKHVPLTLSLLEREQWEERLRKLSARSA